jgi:hypothetical protein
MKPTSKRIRAAAKIHYRGIVGRLVAGVSPQRPDRGHDEVAIRMVPEPFLGDFAQPAQMKSHPSPKYSRPQFLTPEQMYKKKS